MNPASRDQIAAAAATVVVVAAVGAGVLLLRAPSEERTLRLDERRVADLVALSSAVDVYWSRLQRLPASVEELVSEPVGQLDLVDPVSKAVYEYRPIDPRSYEVCATFERDSATNDRGAPDRVWAHRAGRQCFRRTPRQKT
jgi:hypothetical protein